MMPDLFDLIVIGGGPAGYTAALEAASLSRSVLLIERDQLGGTCLNRGCIPTKMLLGAVTARAGIQALERQRVLSGEVKLDFPAMHARMQRFVNGTRQALGKQLAAEGVETACGHAVLDGPGHVKLKTGQGTRDIEADDIIIATGSQPATFPSMQPDHSIILDSTDLLASPEVPESLLIVGGGVSLNGRLRAKLAEVAAEAGVRLLLAQPKYCGDNAAMIAGLAFYRRNLVGDAALAADVQPTLQAGD